MPGEAEGRSHAQSAPPPAYPARCARAPFVRTKGAGPVIPAQAGIQRGGGRRRFPPLAGEMPEGQRGRVEGVGVCAIASVPSRLNERGRTG